MKTELVIKAKLKSGVIILLLLLLTVPVYSQFLNETKNEKDKRMAWWRNAKFGLFIHWGIYSVPAGEWNGKTNYAEWIREQAHIPLNVYDNFVKEFNPVKFNAEQWVKMAKEAGMKYIVITSKHHDGFCMFDSKYTDFDIMSTPYHKDILKSLTTAAHKAGIRIGFYYSIMDWHHPDYLPRRSWEKDRPTEGADFSRYVQYMKNQLRELLTNYGEISVLWFDGQWEDWNSNYGKEIYNYVRSLQPNIIINNRVRAGNIGMEGASNPNETDGDFETPEQEIPATGLPGVDWETCMTMNDHWGYNKNDNNWKTTEDLIRKLVDIASKGGNFLLNVGPTSEGLFPTIAVERLKGIGEWMKVNGKSIYGTTAGPFKDLSWGRCTQIEIKGGTRLFFHVFDWPADGKLTVPGLLNDPVNVYLLADIDKKRLKTSRNEDAVTINLPSKPPDLIYNVLVMDIKGKPDVTIPPSIEADFNIFTDSLQIELKSDRENINIRYTMDGTVPGINSTLYTGKITIDKTTDISARCFRNGMPVSAAVSKSFNKVEPSPSLNISNLKNGILYSYFEGSWDVLPDFNKLSPVSAGEMKNFDISSAKAKEYFGYEFDGFIDIPKDGVYRFYTSSDDGSCLFIDDKLIVNNDELHSLTEKNGYTALSQGIHSIKVTFFQKEGGKELHILYEGPGIDKQIIPDSLLFVKK
jgi:alpha-L-fucosidase